MVFFLKESEIWVGIFLDHLGQNGSVGKEAVFSKERGIYLLRCIDPRVPPRLAWLKVSRIIDIWVKAKYKKGTAEIIEPVKLSMNGNTVTVFIIQLGGFSQSEESWRLCLLLEMGFHKISVLRKTMGVEFLRACRLLDWLFSFMSFGLALNVSNNLFSFNDFSV